MRETVIIAPCAVQQVELATTMTVPLGAQNYDTSDIEPLLNETQAYLISTRDAHFLVPARWG